MLDTGADVTVIDQQSWPCTWPAIPTIGVEGVGGLTNASRSEFLLQGRIRREKEEIRVSPYIAAIGFNILGREALAQLHCVVSNLA